MHKIYGNRSNYSGPAVFGDFIDYAGLYQPVHVVNNEIAENKIGRAHV